MKSEPKILNCNYMIPIIYLISYINQLSAYHLYAPHTPFHNQQHPLSLVRLLNLNHCQILKEIMVIAIFFKLKTINIPTVEVEYWNIGLLLWMLSGEQESPKYHLSNLWFYPTWNWIHECLNILPLHGQDILHSLYNLKLKSWYSNIPNTNCIPHILILKLYTSYLHFKVKSMSKH